MADRPLLIDMHVSLGTVDTTVGMAGSAIPAVNGGAMAVSGTTVEHVVGATRCSKWDSGTIMTHSEIRCELWLGGMVE